MEGRRQFHEAADDRLIIRAWYGEAMARMKKLPALDTLLSSGPKREDQTPDDMLAVMRGIQAAGGSVTIELVDEGDL